MTLDPEMPGLKKGLKPPSRIFQKIPFEAFIIKLPFSSPPLKFLLKPPLQSLGRSLKAPEKRQQWQDVCASKIVNVSATSKLNHGRSGDRTFKLLPRIDFAKRLSFKKQYGVLVRP